MNETRGENYESHDRLDKFLKCLARPMSWDLCSAARLGIRNHEKLREILFVLWTPFLFPSSFFFSSPNLYRETNKFFINFFQRFSIWADRYLRIVDDLFSLRLLPSLLQKSFTVWFVFLGKQRWNLFRLRCSLEEQVQVFFRLSSCSRPENSLCSDEREILDVEVSEATDFEMFLGEKAEVASC